MWFFKKFKMSEILSVTTFDIIYTSNFDTSVYTIPRKDPKTQLGENWKTWQTRNSIINKN
jgi:hypothetical protein